MLAQILEVSKPRIVVLLVITAVTSLYAAETLFVMPDSPNYLTYLNIIIVGAVASAGSSALNHYYDRDIDPAMTRTSKRPIPSGSISPEVVLVYGLAASCASVIYAYFALNPLRCIFYCTWSVLLRNGIQASVRLILLQLPNRLVQVQTHTVQVNTAKAVQCLLVCILRSWAFL